MKKYFFLIITLCLCIFLVACDAEDPENLFEATRGQETVQALVTTEPVAEVAEGYYQYGNMQKNVPSGNFMRYGDSIMFTAIQNGTMLLYTYDMATGEVSLLCQDATCTHNPDDKSAKDCPSNKVWGNLEQYDGKLYAITSDRQIITLKGEHFEPILDGAVSGMWHAVGNLYVRTEDKSLLVYENGNGSPRILMDEYVDYWNTVFGQYLYGYDGEAISCVDLLAENLQKKILVENCSGMTDGKYIYYENVAENYHLYRCSMDGSNPELLLDQPVLPASLNFDDDYLYFRLYTDRQMTGEDSYNLYRMSKDSPAQVEKIAELEDSVFQIFTVPGYDKIFVTSTAQNENDSTAIYVMGTDGSNITLLELPDY